LKEKFFKCGIPGCEKGFTTKCQLQTHHLAYKHLAYVATLDEEKLKLLHVTKLDVAMKVEQMKELGKIS